LLCNFLSIGARYSAQWRVSYAGVSGLRGLQITVPEAVPTGELARLKCDYDLEKDLLYTIKWYRGDEEFYRYVPKESPPTRVFPLQGIHVDVSTHQQDTVLSAHWLRAALSCNLFQ